MGRTLTSPHGMVKLQRNRFWPPPETRGCGKPFYMRKGDNFVILHLKWRNRGEKVKRKVILERSQKNEERLKVIRSMVSEMPHWWKDQEMF